MLDAKKWFSAYLKTIAFLKKFFASSGFVPTVLSDPFSVKKK